jgi:hypothetical protein
MHVSGEFIYLFHIFAKNFEGGGHSKQRLGIGNCLNPPNRRSTKEISRNGHGMWSYEIQNRLTRVPNET